ncbi:MAG: hypothetical protein ACHREM_33615 [Polyangiales bacterium]
MTLPRSMTFVARRLVPLVASLALVACADVFDPKTGDLRDLTVAYPEAGAGESGAISFEYDIRPLMNRSETDASGHGCRLCHYPGQGTQLGLLESGLDLSSLGQLRKGAINATAQDSGSHPIIDTANPENSAIVQKLRGTFFHGVQMPKNGPAYWSPDEIALLVTWIAQGAKGDPDE